MRFRGRTLFETRVWQQGYKVLFLRLAVLLDDALPAALRRRLVVVLVVVLTGRTRPPTARSWYAAGVSNSGMWQGQAARVCNNRMLQGYETTV